MTFGEWIILLCTAPLWAPFAFVGVVLVLELVALACVGVVAVVIAAVEAFRR